MDIAIIIRSIPEIILQIFSGNFDNLNIFLLIFFPKDKKISWKLATKIENKNEKPHVNSTEFASMITNKVNQSVKEDKTVHNDIKPEIKSGNKDYVTDDQFFDDFFSDDDD